MIRVQLSNAIVGIGFAYRTRPLSENEEKLLKSAEKVLALNPEQLGAVRRDALRNQLKFTKCVLYELNSLTDTFKTNLKSIAEVITRCSDDDSFSKEKGRKAALADVMTKAGLNKDRYLMWAAYRNRSRNGAKSV